MEIKIVDFRHIVATESSIIYCWVFDQWLNIPLASTCLPTHSPIWTTGQYALGSKRNGSWGHKTFGRHQGTTREFSPQSLRDTQLRKKLIYLLIYAARWFRGLLGATLRHFDNLMSREKNKSSLAFDIYYEEWNLLRYAV